MVSLSEVDLPIHTSPPTMISTELTLLQLREINGAGAPINEYSKLHKPKGKKEIKPAKPLTLKDVLNGGGSPGPTFPDPEPDYNIYQSYNTYSQVDHWM